MTEALASPTLALLYLAQGHRSRARATLDEVLAADPFNGHALALVPRVRALPPVRLGAQLVAESPTGSGASLELRWFVDPRHLEGDERLSLALGISRLRAADPALCFEAHSCSGTRGRKRLPAGRGPASAAVALIASTSGAPELPISEAGQRVLAVADVVSW